MGLLSLRPELAQWDVAHCSGDCGYQVDVESIPGPGCLIAPLVPVSGG